MSVVLGVDIGGSHITAALVDLESRTVIPGSRKRKLVDSKAGLEEIIGEWCEVTREVFKHTVAEDWKVGIAMPGPFDYDKGICLIKDQDKFQSLYNQNLCNLLGHHLGIEPHVIKFMNDAACFLQGEVFGGAARGYNSVIGLTLGTGLGSATCRNGIAEDADLWKSPFKEGIAEDYLSTRWFVDRYKQLSKRTVTGVKELMDEDSPFVMQLFIEFGTNLGEFLVPQIKANQAEVVVLGGNIANALPLFLSPLEKVTRDNGLHVVLKQALLNEDASLIGAASCWQEGGIESGVESRESGVWSRESGVGRKNSL
ncbi:MAG TPA: ROK family protein [Flavisolibacter sp.]|nr:ROK family protein [Flavisolibacter sp.]